jgi:hypothetical protein
MEGAHKPVQELKRKGAKILTLFFFEASTLVYCHVALQVQPLLCIWIGLWSKYTCVLACLMNNLTFDVLYNGGVKKGCLERKNTVYFYHLGVCMMKIVLKFASDA